jgi:ribosomal protein S18 acetylase RimI-like enzyme
VSEIEIRPARFADPAVQKLVTELLADLGERYGGSGDDTPVDPGDFDPPAGVFFVAYDGDRLVGCAGWRAHGNDAELKRMYTAPAARGRGLARLLVGALVADAAAAGIETLTLDVRGNNHAAMALYESFGFVVHGRRPDFVAVGDERWDQVMYGLDLRAAGAALRRHGARPIGPGSSGLR